MTTRIVRIVSQLNISGRVLQTILLTDQMQKMDYECILIASRPAYETDSMEETARGYNVEPILLPPLVTGAMLTVIPDIWQMYRLIKQLKPDIVHTHNPRAGFIGRIAARMAGVPVVVHTLHEYPFRGYYNWLETIIFIYMERFGAYLSDSIITLSQGLRQELAGTYRITSKSRITVLPLGFDLKSFAGTPRHQGAFRKAWNIPDNAPLIGNVGRLIAVKNQQLFLDMARQLQDTFPDARFVIIGDGDERKALQTYAKEQGIADRVIFTGWQKNIEDIYSDLDVLVNTSLNEGTPVPIIEALATACPVVATAVGGVPELLDGNPGRVTVPSNDLQALCNAVSDVIANPPDMTAVQETMLRRFSIDRLAKDLDSLYRGLLLSKQK